MTHFGLDERFDVSEGTLSRTLQRALTKGGERSDVFLEHRATTSLLLEEGQVKRAAHTADRGAGVRAICGARVGYAHTEELTPRAFAQAASVAARVASSPVERSPSIPGFRRPAAGAQLSLLFEARRPPAGQFPVVLAAGSSGILLHEAIGHGLEADFNRKGVSIFADRMGSQVASPHVTSFLHDSISAAHYGVAPTGSARRESFRFAPLPRMRCTYLLPGPVPGGEVVQSVKRGLHASTFGNGQVQIGAGDFSFYVRLGWWIEDGRLAWPVKDVNLIGNGPQVLAGIDLVGDDLRLDEGAWMCGKAGQAVPVGMGLPTVRVPSLTLGGVGP